MFNINEFLDYASDGNVSAPKRIVKPVHRPTAPVTRYTGPVLVSSLANRLALPSGPLVVTTYQGDKDIIQAASILAPEPPKPALELVNYSERSFAIFGDTKPLKEKLMGLGGKFNAYLRRDGIATPGYIFSIGRKDAVRKALNI